MQRTLMCPMLTDERRERVEVTLADGARHVLRELAHAAKREEHLCIAPLVCTGDRGDRVCRDARLSSVDNDAAPLHLFPCLTSERDLRDVCASV